MGVFTPETSKDFSKALKEVNQMTDQAKLKQTAFESPHALVRLSAADRLSDKTLAQKAYAEVAIDDAFNWYREAAIDYLTDQKALAYVVKSEITKSKVRLMALEKLISQEELADIAMNQKYGALCVKAAIKLGDQTVAQEVFTHFAKSGEDSLVRIEAAENLTDHSLAQEVFSEIAKNDERGYVCERARKKLIDLYKV